MLCPGDWEFCRKPGCNREHGPDFGRHDLFFLGQRLGQLKSDALKMHALRAQLVHERNAREIADLSDEQVIDQTAALLIRGRLHVHIRTVRLVPGRGSSTPASPELSAAFPLSERVPRQQVFASRPSGGNSASGPSNASSSGAGQTGSSNGSSSQGSAPASSSPISSSAPASSTATGASAPDSSPPSSAPPSSVPDSSPPSSTPPSSAPDSSPPKSAPTSSPPTSSPS